MRAKRIMDIAFAASALLVVAPLLLLIAAAVVIVDGRPVFYLGTRVGQHGQVFRLIKFRTMTHSESEPVPGISVTVWDDPRVTHLGGWLRRMKLDELPQLLNVLRGELSLVGPRPEDPEYVALYTADQMRVLEVKPGVTGVAALQYWDEARFLKGDDWESVYRERLVPAKLALELEYARRRTLRSDLGVMARTVYGLFHHLAGGRQSPWP